MRDANSDGGARRRRPAWRGVTALSVLAGLFVASGAGATLPAGAAAATGCGTAATATAAQDASTTGVTATSVTVGNVSIISGPVPGLFQGAPIGVKAYFAYENAHGGVNGRKLLVDSKDDAFSSQQNATETQQSIASDFALVGSFSLFDGYGCQALAANTAVPDVSVTLDAGANALPNNFSAEPTTPGAALGPFNYYKKHYPADRTIGAIVSDVASAKAQWAGEAAAAEHDGFKVGYVDYVNPLQSDFTTDVINMRSKGVNAVDLTAVDWQDAAIFMQNAVTQGWKPGLVFSAGPVYADQFIAHAGGPAVANGIQLGTTQGLYLGQDAARVPADKLFLQYVHRVNPSWVPDLYTLFGWASAQLFVQALKAAGPHPTRGAVIAQLEKITRFDASGLLAPTDPAAKKPSGCYLMAGIKNGTFVREYPSGHGYACNASYFYASKGGS
jgi:ABC-type branched-subunit amino acid transport system substrate-binding protein